VAFDIDTDFAIPGEREQGNISSVRQVEVQTDRLIGQPGFTVPGRLDAYGAGRLPQATSQHLAHEGVGRDEQAAIRLMNESICAVALARVEGVAECPRIGGAGERQAYHIHL
jgi:hypothetical protein